MLFHRTLVTCILTLLASGASCTSGFPKGALPVIPGGYGYGIETPAGRGGVVYRVSNLNDSGPGSLRAALEATGKRIVIFEVSGVIDLGDRIEIESPYLTVAGQTAPGPGICVKGGIVVLTHDVLMQHIAVRQWPGEDYTDCISVGYGGGYETDDIVIDHCSFSYASDEIIEISSSAGHDITISNCTLACSDSSGGAGYAALWRSDSGSAKIACIRNLFAHNRERGPLVSCSMYFADNVEYDHYHRQISIEGDSYGATPAFGYTIESNAFVQRQGEYIAPPIHFAGTWSEDTRIHVAGNYWSERPGAPNGPDDWWNDDFMYLGHMNEPLLSEVKSSSRQLVLPEYEPYFDREAIIDSIVRSVGVRPAERHSCDRELIEGIKSGKGTRGLPQSFPEYEERSRRLIPPDDPHGDDDGDGYTNIEEWLHAFALEVERG